MNKQQNKKHLGVLFCLSLFLVGPTRGQDLLERPPLANQSYAKTVEPTEVVGAANLVLAKELGRSGIHSLAERQFSTIVEDPDAPEGILLEAKLGLFDSYLARGKLDRASEVLKSIDASIGPGRELRKALLDLLIDGPEETLADPEFDFGPMDLSAIGEEYISWYYLLQSLVSEQEGRTAEADDFLNRARDFATDVEQVLFLDDFDFRREFGGEGFDAQARLAELKKLFDRPRATPGIARVVENYINLLNTTAGPNQAIVALDDALSRRSFGFTPAERTRLLLLKSILIGPSGEERRAILRSILTDGVGEATMELALQLLLSETNDSAELFGFLSGLLEREGSHPLSAKIVFLRSQLGLLGAEALELAEEDARYLLEEFPGAPEASRAYQILAYAALLKDPPQYRSAAEYLLQYKESLSGELISTLSSVDLMIGDAYFLNEDYPNAADFYRSAFFAEEDRDVRRDVFLRLVIADLRGGSLGRAIEFVDSLGATDGVSGADRWKAEWNISQRLLSEGRTDYVLDRVGSLLISDEFDQVPALLDIRLRWLNLYLRSITRDFDGLSEEAATLLRRIESMPTGSEADNELPVLRSETMILYAAALLGEGDFDAAVAVLREIRADYPTSDAAERTFLTEASYFASTSDFRAAQTILVALVDNYPEGELAATALFQAALYAERRGPYYYRDAILILARLVESYPDAPVAYEASLRQGDLLRLTNDFASAQLLYDNLVNAFPEHPMRHRAELGRADCMVALAKGDRAELADAAVVLERFLDLPDLSDALRAEASHKWGMTLLKRGAADDARQVFTEIVARFLVESERAAEMDAVGQYWLSRSVFALGDILERDGEAGEARRLYRLMIALNMPGRTISAERLGSLSEVEVR